MRLIDADAFERFIHEHCQDSLVDLWCELIKMQPTAYDVDKVAEKIEQYIANDPCNVNGACPWEENIGISCAICGAMGALKIVKDEV